MYCVEGCIIFVGASAGSLVPQGWAVGTILQVAYLAR
jgi:hypothetical protein